MAQLVLLWEAFLLGLATPLGAICVLPIYPGFLVYLSSQISGTETSRKTIFLFGVIITSGVIPDNPAELLHCGPNTQLLREGHSARVVQRQLEVGGSELEVFCKQSRRRNLLRKRAARKRRHGRGRVWVQTSG